jgi:hypothetical protein
MIEEKVNKLKDMLKGDIFLTTMITHFERINNTLMHYHKFKSSYNYLKNQKMEMSLNVSFDGCNVFAKEIHKVHLFLLIEMKKYFMFMEEKATNEQKETIKKLFEEIITYYKKEPEMSIYSTFEENQKELIENYLYMLSFVTFIIPVISLKSFSVIDVKEEEFPTINKSRLQNYICSFKQNVLEDFYIRSTDKAIHFISSREKELLRKYEIMISKQKIVSTLGLIISSKKYQWFIEETIDKELDEY